MNRGFGFIYFGLMFGVLVGGFIYSVLHPTSVKDNVEKVPQIKPAAFKSKGFEI